MWLFILLSFLLLTSLNLDSPAVSDLQGKVSKWSSDVNKIKAPLEFIIKTDRAALGERDGGKMERWLGEKEKNETTATY